MSDPSDLLAEAAVEIAMKAVFDLKALDDELSAGQAASLIAIGALSVLKSFEGRLKASEVAYRYGDQMAVEPQL